MFFAFLFECFGEKTGMFSFYHAILFVTHISVSLRILRFRGKDKSEECEQELDSIKKRVLRAVNLLRRMKKLSANRFLLGKNFQMQFHCRALRQRFSSSSVEALFSSFYLSIYSFLKSFQILQFAGNFVTKGSYRAIKFKKEKKIPLTVFC